MPILPHYGPIADQNNLNRFIDDVKVVVSTQVGSWNFDIDQLTDRLGTCQSSVDVLLRLYELEASHNGAQRCFIKDNGIVESAFQIAALYPETVFVYLVRDPRDVAASWVESVSHGGGVKDAARIWAHEQRLAINFMSSFFDQNRLITIKYEDLMAQPENCLREICRFAGEKFSTQMLDYHKSAKANDDSERTSDWKNLAKPLLTGNTQKYRTQLTRRSIKAIESIKYYEMQMLDYVPEHATIGKISEGSDMPRKVIAGLKKLVKLAGSRRGREEFQEKLARMTALYRLQTEIRRRHPKWYPSHRHYLDRSDSSGGDLS